ncbi:MAG: hypothetical protein ACE5R6_11275 [Candidatus Heimdallarchaeota archaeon]
MIDARIPKDLLDDEKQILVTLLKAKQMEITEGMLKNELIKQKLTAMNLISYVPKKGRQRVGRYKLTTLGMDVAQKVSEELDDKSTMSKKLDNKLKKMVKNIITQLKQDIDSKFQNQSIILDEIFRRLEIIESRLNITERKSIEMVSVDQKDLPSVLKDVYEEVCSVEANISDMISLSALKSKLYEKYTLSNELVDKTLLKLEKERKIDLQVAYNIESLKGVEYGIKVPGRGLVFYIRWRRYDPKLEKMKQPLFSSSDPP